MTLHPPELSGGGAHPIPDALAPASGMRQEEALKQQSGGGGGGTRPERNGRAGTQGKCDRGAPRQWSCVLCAPDTPKAKADP